MKIDQKSEFANFILRTLPKILCVAIVYYFVARLGLNLASINNFASPVWPATGVALIFILLWGSPMAVGVFIGAVVANYNFATPLYVVLGIGVGNTLEAFVAVKIFHHMSQVMNRLGSYSRIVVYVAVATISTVISASIGTSCLLVGQQISFEAARSTWLTWWVGDTLGALILFPVGVKIWRGEFSSVSVPLAKVPHLVLVLLTALGLCGLVFTTAFGAPYLFVIFLSLLLATIWLSSLWVYLVSIFICTFAIFSTKFGQGPFYSGNLNDNLIHLQLFLAGVGLTAIVLVILQKERFLKTPSLALLFGWILTGMSFYSFYQSAASSDQENFSFQAVNAERNLRENLDSYIRLIETGSGLFAASEDVTREEWQAFSTRLRFEDQYPGINGIGVIVPVERFHGVPEVSLHEVYSAPEEMKVKNAPLDLFIKYIEPIEKNRNALGLLISSERRRLEGALRARDSGIPAITEELTLVQTDVEHPGFVLYAPFYQRYMPIETVEQRRKAFKGLVFSPIIVDKFVNSSLHKFKRELDLKIFFGKDTNPKHQVFSSGNWEPKDRQVIKSNTKLAHMPVTMVWKRGPGFPRQSTSVASWAGFCGSLIAIFLAIVLSSLENITERAKKIAEETTYELLQSEKQLQDRQMALVASSRMSSLGQMASGMAHEINNPLAIISGKAQHLEALLAENPVNVEKVQQHIKVINSNVERIAKIIRGLRSIARDVPDDPFRDVRAEEIMQDALGLCCSRFKHHEVALIIPNEIPANVTCYARPEQIVQVLLNLLNNAFDAVEGLPEKWVKVDVEAHEGQKKVQFMITDSGKGMSKDLTEKIFDPFFTTKDVGKGTGLGLSISRGIIEKHRGRIFVDTSAENTKIVVELESRGTHAEENSYS